jgi:hypothetical protein
MKIEQLAINNKDFLMINSDEARARLHQLIDDMPDDQVALVWMTFQSMFAADFDDDDGEEDQDS